MKLYDHQKQALEITKDQTHVAYYHDMGLGKTFTGAEKMMQLRTKTNLVVCQKSKVSDWYNHFKQYYRRCVVWDCTQKDGLQMFFNFIGHDTDTIIVGIINYELAFRRPELKNLKDFTLMLDESSMIKNEQAKRSKFVLKLQPKNVILLSGTPTGGKYEELWSQMHLLGWDISKKMFYNHYVDFHYDDSNGFPQMVIDGYKNEERLKRKMREHGCHFLKTDEVFDLPDQIHQTIGIGTTKEYRTFRKKSIVILKNDGPLPLADNTEKDWEPEIELVGENTLTKMLYERQLCGQYNQDKLEAFKDLVESTNDRLVVFYNFTEEWNKMGAICDQLERPSSVVNGQLKHPEVLEKEGAVLFVQYQAGAMGLNLQKANKIIYFTPPLSSELFEQSKKRIHRIGQDRTCFYYYLTCKNSIEEKIYRTLEMRKDYTEKLFVQDL